MRLEFNLKPVEMKVFALTLGRIIKMLKMSSERLPRICLLWEVHLFLNRPPMHGDKENKRFNKYNWVSQVSLLLAKIGESNMWSELRGGVLGRT